MTAQHLLGLEQIPWDLVAPLTAALVAGSMAFVLSRLVFPSQSEAKNAQPEEKPTPEYDPFVQGSATEQRNAFRRGGNPVEVLLASPEEHGKQVHGWVVDRSVGGLCLTVDEAYTEGTVLTVRTLNAPPATPWVEVAVKSCRQTKDAWELGCQFVKTPPWAVMLLFG
jgi:PilZ domain